MLRYREIKLAIKDIVSGMNNGDKLPSRVVLSKRLDASRATIEKAIRELTEEGILESKFGSGTYVARRLEGVVQNVRNCLIKIKNEIFALTKLCKYQFFYSLMPKSDWFA